MPCAQSHCDRVRRIVQFCDGGLYLFGSLIPQKAPVIQKPGNRGRGDSCQLRHIFNLSHILNSPARERFHPAASFYAKSFENDFKIIAAIMHSFVNSESPQKAAAIFYKSPKGTCGRASSGFPAGLWVSKSKSALSRSIGCEWHGMPNRMFMRVCSHIRI